MLARTDGVGRYRLAGHVPIPGRARPCGDDRPPGPRARVRPTEPFTLDDHADDTAGLLRELGVRDAVVAGYSMGGPVALLLARRHPTWCVAWCWPRPRPSWPAPVFGRGAFVHLLGPLFRSGLPDRVLARVSRSRMAFLGDLAELSPQMAGETKRLVPTNIVGTGRAIAGFDARSWVPRAGKPAASVVTLRDRGRSG